MKNWLSTLEKKLEAYSEGSHDNYRVYISAEPAPTPDAHIIPGGILETSIKITNEPPTGMLANLHQALDNFNQVNGLRDIDGHTRADDPRPVERSKPACRAQTICQQFGLL